MWVEPLGSVIMTLTFGPVLPVINTLPSSLRLTSIDGCSNLGLVGTLSSEEWCLVSLFDAIATVAPAAGRAAHNHGDTELSWYRKISISST